MNFKVWRNLRKLDFKILSKKMLRINHKKNQQNFKDNSKCDTALNISIRFSRKIFVKICT